MDLTLSHPWTDDDGTFYDVDSRLDVEESTANRLVANGIAVPSTKSAAKEAGLDPETAKTAK